MIDAALSLAVRGWTPAELARLLRVRADKVRSWIKRGELGAVNTASTMAVRAQWVVLPHHLAEWERRRAATPPPKPPRRRKRTYAVDYYPD
jgi:excisionase family DNA binding protein